MHQAIGAFAVRKRGLHGVAVGGQGALDDVVQLDFPERAARLLVRQDVLQGQHIARQLFDIRLRLVDGFQPGVQIPQAAGGAHGVALQRFRHQFGHLRQPLFQHLHHLALCLGLCFGHMMQATRQMLLSVRQRLHALAQLAHLPLQGLHTARGLQRRVQDHQQDQRDDQCGDPAQNQRVAEINRTAHRRPNSFSMSDSFSST